MDGYFFFQAEDGIRDLVRSRGLGDVYKRQERGGLLGETQALAAQAGEHALVVDHVDPLGADVVLSLIHI